MLGHDFGERKGLTTFAEVEKVASLLRDLPCEWYVCGGWAVDLFLGRVTRAHKDVDVSVARRNQLEVRQYMNARGWRLEKAHDGRLTPWEDGEFLSPPLHTVWCRSDAHEPDFVEFQLDEIDDERFAFRRDASVTLPRGRMSFTTPSGVPVLAPDPPNVIEHLSPLVDALSTSHRVVCVELPSFGFSSGGADQKRAACASAAKEVNCAYSTVGTVDSSIASALTAAAIAAA